MLTGRTVRGGSARETLGAAPAGYVAAPGRVSRPVSPRYTAKAPVETISVGAWLRLRDARLALDTAIRMDAPAAMLVSLFCQAR